MDKPEKKDQSNNALFLIAGALVGIGVGIYLASSDKALSLEKLRSKLMADEQASDAEDQASVGEEISQTLDQLVSNLSHKADDLIEALEQKLADLKEKNAQFQK